jgi:hypothetical protein
MIRCKQCDGDATVHFMWPTSIAPQKAYFCDTHAALWWKQYQHTLSGQCLTITKLTKELEEA